MQYIKSVQAALRASAPFVGIPVEGHAPACIKAKLLKGAMKGVMIISSAKIVTDKPTPNCNSGRWLEIKGVAEGGVHTYCKIVVQNIKDYNVWKELSRWTDKEREKRLKVIAQGVLNPAERKALKLQEALAKEEKRRNAELIAAKREEQDILDEAREGVFPVITPLDDDERAKIMAEYAEFRRCRHIRKRGSVIRWKLKQLREYREQESHSWHRRRRIMTGKKTVLRRKGDTLKYAALIYQIGQLEARYKTLYPPRWHEFENCTGPDGKPAGMWVESFQERRPRAQAYRVPWGWHDGCVGGSEEYEEPYQDEDGEWSTPRKRLTGISRLAERLREARANIRALSTPADEDDNGLAIAA